MIKDFIKKELHSSLRLEIALLWVTFSFLFGLKAVLTDDAIMAGIWGMLFGAWIILLFWKVK
jgi:hypothetical protein